MAQIIIVVHIPDNLKCHMRQSLEDTGAREEGNCRQRSRSLLSLLVDGSPGGEILQLLLQFLTTLPASSRVLDAELHQLLLLFHDEGLQHLHRGTTILMQLLPAGVLLLQQVDLVAALRIVLPKSQDLVVRLCRIESMSRGGGD